MRKLLLFILILCCGTVAEAKRTGMYLFFDLPQNHLYEDEYIKLFIAFENNEAKVVFYNKTDEVIYVDKENTFAYINNVPENLFKNSAQTVGTSTNTGATVNMGSVASVLGIGGPLGTLANGVNVGGGSGTTNSTVTYEKRILSVAPKALATLHSWNPVDNLQKANYYSSYGFFPGEYGHFNNPDVKFKKGMVKNFMPDDSPLQYKAVIRYSLQENFSTYNQATVDNYLAHIVIDSYKGVKKGNPYRQYCNNYCQSLPYVAGVIGKGNWTAWIVGIGAVGLACDIALIAAFGL